MRPRMLLDALVLLTITACCVGGQPTQRAQPAQAAAAIMVRDGQAVLIIIAPYNPDLDEVVNGPLDEDGYVWELRDTADRVLRKGRAPKTIEWRSEWGADGKPDPRVLRSPTPSIDVVVPNVGGTVFIFDAKPGADTGPQVATLRLPVVPARAVWCVTLTGTLECDY